MTYAILVLLGLGVGALSGALCIGGGVVLIPALVALLGFSQAKAQGTTIAMMVPPIGLLASLAYYKEGLADLKVAGILCLGFVLGGYLGAKFAITMPDALLKRCFGGFLLLVGLKYLLAK